MRKTTRKGSKRIERVSIVLRPESSNIIDTILPHLVKWLRNRKRMVIFHPRDRKNIEKVKISVADIAFKEEDELFTETDLILTLGGDGTLLGVGRRCKKNAAPIFGINLGKLGFITEFSRHDFYEQLEKVLAGNFQTCKISLFKTWICDPKNANTSVKKSFFLNDLVVTKGDISRIFSLSVSSELSDLEASEKRRARGRGQAFEEQVFKVAGDGLIVSSSTGSTAYSLAAGGPIIHPDVSAIALTPICPHSLIHRPIVIPDHFSLAIKILDKNETALVTLDGQELQTLSSQQVLKIQKSKNHSARLVVGPNKQYFQTLRDKFTVGRST